MLIEADPGLTLVLDGFEASVQRVFASPGKKQTVAKFTPDDESVLMGTEDGMIHCWNIQTGTIVNTLEGHRGPIGALACNPKYAQIASSCSSTCLWIW
jgi:WD40 repeat protein